MKVDTMSRNVVRIMKLLSQNEGLMRLLINNEECPLNIPVSATDKKNALRPNSDEAKLLPYPFDVEAKTKDGSFIRVYYSQGDFEGNQTISESTLHIDIIVAKSLWLIYTTQSAADNIKFEESLIRPYEIMDRVVDILGAKGIGDVRLDIKGYQHHYINTKFDSIRLYCEYMSLETMQQNKR